MGSSELVEGVCGKSGVQEGSTTANQEPESPPSARALQLGLTCPVQVCTSPPLKYTLQSSQAPCAAASHL